MSNTRWPYPDLKQKRTPYGQAWVYIDELRDELAALRSENERLRLELSERGKQMFGYDVDAFKRKWFEKGYDQARKDLEQGSDPLHQQVNALKQALVVLGYENQKLQQAVAKSIEERLNDYAQN